MSRDKMHEKETEIFTTANLRYRVNSWHRACAPFQKENLTTNLKPGANESQKTLNKCETRNKTVFQTRLRHPETINSVPLNSVLRIKQTGI